MSQQGLAQPPSRRLEIDILKGAALLGILVVNFYGFSMGVFSSFDRSRLATHSTGDYVVEFLVQWLVQAKFVLIFSFLFGWGVHTQTLQGDGFRSSYLRRLLGLFLIGLIHVAFAFSGDVLTSYAVLGLFMLRPVRKAWSSAQLRRNAIIWLAVHTVMLAIFAGLLMVFPSDPTDDDLFRSHAEVYATGSFLEVSIVRLSEFCVTAPMAVLLLGMQIVAMFRLGLAAARALEASDLTAAQQEARTLVRFLLAPALAASAMGAWGSLAASPGTDLAVTILTTMAAPFQALAYLGAALLLLTGPLKRRLATTLGAAGRNSLSVYLGQSVIMSLLFSGYGLGLYGKVGPAAGLMLAVTVYGVLVVLAVLWSRVFRIGPVEWLLRSFTAWQRVPLRRHT